MSSSECASVEVVRLGRANSHLRRQDLSQPDTVLAVVDQLDGLFTRLERKLEKR